MVYPKETADRSENGPYRNTRRRFVTLLGTTGAVAVAGCADNGEPPEDGAGAPEDDGDGVGDEDEEDDAIGDEEDDDDGAGAEDGETYELRILVEDSMGEPVENASVEIEDDAGELATDEPVETDGSGEAVAQVPDGDYTVRVQGDGAGEAEEQVSIAGADEELTIMLEEDGEPVGEDDPAEEDDDPAEEDDDPAEEDDDPAEEDDDPAEEDDDDPPS